jgi:hypothetical protein
MTDRPVPRGLDEAVGRGLAYLARQQHADGSFNVFPRDGKDADGPKYAAAATGLALLAFLSAGHTPDVGRYGMVSRNAADYLAAAVPADGYVGRGDERGMYAQAIVTLALAEAYGVEPNPDKRRRQYAALRRLVGVILKAQDVKKDQDAHAGGWRYTPEARDSDLSLSGWNALALRAAQGTGLPVPEEALARAADFVTRCYSKDRRAFAYVPGGEVRPGTTGTGVLCLYLLDRAERPEAKEGAKSLAERPPDEGDGRYPYYTLYYVTQAAWQADDDVWAKASKATLDRLIGTQQPDGGWPKEPAGGEPGRVYRTAMAVLTLTVPYRLLPAYQR